GPILYQLPPRFRLNLERLESFLRLVPKDVTNVFEFREPSWYTDEVFALLDRYGASFCAHDMPGSQSPRLAVGPIAYVRFHGGLAAPRVADACLRGRGGRRADIVAVALTSAQLPHAQPRAASRGEIDARGNDEASWATDCKVECFLADE